MRRNGFTFVEALVVVVTILIFAAIFWPVTGRGPYIDRKRSDCQSHLKQISLGFKQYIQDYDEKFPPIAVPQSGYWAGSLQPYLKTWEIFQCPTPKRHIRKTTDYFYNARLAKVKELDVIFPTQTVLTGEGRDDSPLNYSLTQLPDVWRQNEKSPAWRHKQGANYAFADGHIKWIYPAYMTNKSPMTDNVFTFALS